MKVAAFILSHFKERVENIHKSIDALRKAPIAPDQIIVLNDNPDIEFYNYFATCINSTSTLPVISRYAVGLCLQADRILFLDDDLMVGKETLLNFITYSKKYPDALLGLEGNILNRENGHPYTNGETVDRGNHTREVDIIIRTYFATPEHLAQAMYTRELFKGQLPEKSIDDIILCMANKYQYSGKNIVIPVDMESDVIELDPFALGQCTNPQHYNNRNLACLTLL